MFDLDEIGSDTSTMRSLLFYVSQYLVLDLNEIELDTSKKIDFSYYCKLMIR